MSIIIYTAGVVFAFGIIIFVHEFGHFIVAKKSGVKVDRFSFGLGPEMIGFQWGETRYCIAWLPLGGEVRMAGEMPDENAPVPNPTDASVDRSREFFSQPWYRRIFIALAGPTMNYVLAIIIFFGMLILWGEPVQTNRSQVGDVLVGMAADKAGLRKGDVILQVEGAPVDDFMAIKERIEKRAGEDTTLLIKRGDQNLTFVVTPDKETKKIGIAAAEPVFDKHPVSTLPAFKKSVWMCWNISAFNIYYLAQKIRTHERPDLAGPIGIGQVIVKAVKSGKEDFFYLIGMISVALGLFNLFPIPMLDGGHVAYYLIEGVRGRPVSQKFMAKANMVGLAFLMAVLVFATFNDLQRFRGPKAQPVATQQK